MVLLACTADCPEGSVLGPDGLCRLIDEVVDTDESVDTDVLVDTDEEADTGTDTTLMTAPPAGPWEAITVGGFHGCVRAGTEVACWGYNSAGQLSVPKGEYTAVSAGLMHSCALETTGEVSCWGDNAHGQADVPAGSYTAVSAGMTHSCAVTTEGELVCWGSDIVGQASPPKGTYVSVSTGGYISAAVSTEGRLSCWGLFDHCIQSDLKGITAVSAGFQHLIALSKEGVACGGFGGEGRCPEADLVLSSASAGGYQSCGMLKENELRCWPSENHEDGQTWPDGWFTVVSSGFQMSCAIDESGEVVCWESDGAAIEW